MTNPIREDENVKSLTLVEKVDSNAKSLQYNKAAAFAAEIKAVERAYMRGRFDSARKLLKRSLSRELKVVLDDENDGLPELFYRLASLYFEQKEYKHSEEVLRKAEHSFARKNRHAEPLICKIHGLLGKIQWSERRYDEAAKSYRKQLAAVGKVYGRTSVNIREPLTALVEIYEKIDRKDLAHKLRQQMQNETSPCSAEIDSPAIFSDVGSEYWALAAKVSRLLYQSGFVECAFNTWRHEETNTSVRLKAADNHNPSCHLSINSAHVASQTFGCEQTEFDWRLIQKRVTERVAVEKQAIVAQLQAKRREQDNERIARRFRNEFPDITIKPSSSYDLQVKISYSFQWDLNPSDARAALLAINFLENLRKQNRINLHPVPNIEGVKDSCDLR